jgi:hypothetical protein
LGFDETVNRSAFLTFRGLPFQSRRKSSVVGYTGPDVWPQMMKPQRNELTLSSLRVFDEQLEIGKPQKPPSFVYPCHDKSIETTDFSNWSYFQTHNPKQKIVNIGSSHLWNKETLKCISDRNYKIPEIRKKMKISPSKLPTPRTTRAERMRQNYILSMTPTLEDERSVAQASKGAETISQDGSIKSVCKSERPYLGL